MILCVSPSPAWDLTFHVPRLAEHATNRARSVAARAGGKAVNVARVLHQLGEDVVVLAPLGGTTGELMVADLASAGIRVEVVPDEHETRRTVAIVSDETGDATIVNEQARLSDWPALLELFEQLVPLATLVVASGSLPAGAPEDAFAQLVRAARRHDVRTVVDTSGPALRRALEAEPFLVKPNRDELRELVGEAEPCSAACELARRSSTVVVVSLGRDGMLLARSDDVWQAGVDPVPGNPTGAGDAAVAAFAHGIVRDREWSELVVEAATVAARSVGAPVAGELR